MEVCNYANMQICMYVSVQCKYASVYENMQESIQICKYEKYAGMYVYTYWCGGQTGKTSL